MIRSEATFRLLAFCARPPGNPSVAERLRASVNLVPSWDTLIADAEDHALEPLLLAHLHEARIALPASVKTRLQARCVQHAHAYAVRTRVMADALRAVESAGIPVLILKGAALAHLVYRDPLLRPMRDVDLLVRKRDAQLAWRCLREAGFSPAGARLEPEYHHLQGLSATVDGATVTIEIHYEVLRAAPFARPVRYEDVAERAQCFTWAGRTHRTLSREDMLWHVYAHAFVINVLRPGIRLISVADLVTLTETWADELDWIRLERDCGRAFRALPLMHHLTPWSSRVLEKLRAELPRVPAGVRPIASSAGWRDALSRDVWWPPAWWFDVRYGIDGRMRRLWYRFVGHPACVTLVAGQTARRRLVKRLRGGLRDVIDPTVEISPSMVATESKPNPLAADVAMRKS